MKQLKISLSLMGVAILATFAACSKAGQDSTPGGNNQCFAGQVIATSGPSAGQCLNSCVNPSNPNNPNYGYDPALGQCVLGAAVNNSRGLRFENQLSVTNSTVFTQLIKDYSGTCSSPFVYYINLGGGPNYNSLISQSYMEIDVPTASTTQAAISIGLGSVAPDYINPMFGQPLVMTFTGQVWTINGTVSGSTNPNPGVEIQASGNMGTCSYSATLNNGLDIKIPNQNFNNNYLLATISYRGTVFAHAQLIRY